MKHEERLEHGDTFLPSRGVRPVDVILNRPKRKQIWSQIKGELARSHRETE